MLQSLCVGDLNFCCPDFPNIYLNLCYMPDHADICDRLKSVVIVLILFTAALTDLEGQVEGPTAPTTETVDSVETEDKEQALVTLIETPSGSLAMPLSRLLAGCQFCDKGKVDVCRLGGQTTCDYYKLLHYIYPTCCVQRQTATRAQRVPATGTATRQQQQEQHPATSQKVDTSASNTVTRDHVQSGSKPREVPPGDQKKLQDKKVGRQKKPSEQKPVQKPQGKGDQHRPVQQTVSQGTDKRQDQKGVKIQPPRNQTIQPTETVKQQPSQLPKPTVLETPGTAQTQQQLPSINSSL